METTTPQVYTRRRNLLFAALLLLFTLAGFAWGRWLGYEQGKRAMLKRMELQLNGDRQLPVPHYQ